MLKPKIGYVIDITCLCWPSYDPHKNCKAISEIVWMVNSDNDIINHL